MRKITKDPLIFFVAVLVFGVCLGGFFCVCFFFLVLPLLCFFVSGIFLLMSSLLFNAFSHFCHITLFVLTMLHNFNPNKYKSSIVCYYQRLSHRTAKAQNFQLAVGSRTVTVNPASRYAPWQFPASFHHFYVLFTSSPLNLISYITIMLYFD